METGKLKLALSAGALALSMALAGCGGSSSSGGGTSANATPTPTPTPFNREECTTESGTPYVNAAGDACVASCGTGQVVNTARNQCIAEPARNLAGGDKARKLKAALGRGTSIATGTGALTAGQARLKENDPNKFRSIQVDTANSDIVLKEKMDADIAALGEWKGSHFEGSKGVEDAKHRVQVWHGADMALVSG